MTITWNFNQNDMKPTKQNIRSQVVNFFDMFRPGDEFRTEDIVKACKRGLGLKYVYADTVLRYSRELRKEGRINFTVFNKRERFVRVLEIGEAHSR